ncbi:MAG: mechanosensitive ion channel [Actinobacteria bacterium]|nr:mechanosensitive ion channel [Actinomycetota bacterium]
MSALERTLVVGAVIAVTIVAARLTERWLSRRQLDPEDATRLRVLRRTLVSGIVIVGVLSALLAVPQIQAVAGGILASSAVVGLVVGFAAQRTLSNVVAGLLIAFTQPLRIGDRVEIGGVAGVVEEIALTYTFIRTDDRARLVIPNDKLASDTIRNSTIVSREKVAEVTLQVPLAQSLGSVVDLLRAELSSEREPQVFVSALDASATVTIRARAGNEDEAEELEHDLRARAHERLRTEGIYA